MTAFPCPHNLPETGSCSPVGNHHIQIIEANHNIGHEYHLEKRTSQLEFCFTKTVKYGVDDLVSK